MAKPEFLPLTRQEISLQNFFLEQGYLRVGYILSSDEIRNAKEWIWDEAEKRHQQNLRNLSSAQLKEQLDKPVKLYHIYESDSRFENIVKHPKLISSLTPILGPNIELALNRHNHATLNLRGDNTPRLHRDILQWSRAVVTAIIYLDDSTIENGCTWVLPGSQKLTHVPATDHGGTWFDEYIDIYGNLINQAVPVPMTAGGVLLFNSLTFHTAGENKTDGPRTSLTFGFRSVDELSRAQDDVSVLIAGERIQRGNDLPKRS